MHTALQHHHPFAFHPDLYSTGIPLLLLVVPWITVKVFTTPASRGFRYREGVWYLSIASIAWFWAIQLPNVPVSSETESTTMHLIGGFIIGPALYAYFMKAYKVEQPQRWWVRFFALYAFVGGIFGLSNELLEFVGTKLHVLNVDLGDTSWDIFENFVGLTGAFIVFELSRYRFTAWHTPKTARA